MLISTLWITRTYSKDTPEMQTAWGEWDIDANYEGWLEDKKRTLAALGNDLHTYREIDINVDYDAICAQFEDGRVEGVVVAPSNRTAPPEENA